jgi:hypothetical protein
MTTNLIPMSADEFRARLVDEFGEPFTVSYFDRSTFIDGPSPVLHPWSLVANDKFRRVARRFLEREGVRLGAPICNHLKPKPRAA